VPLQSSAGPCPNARPAAKDALRPRRLPPSLAVLTIVILLASCVYGQTASTGALAGMTLDPSGAVLPGVSIDLVNEETTETQSTASDEEGRFGFVLLSPGTYG